ncbi:MAG: ECF transporter S component [Clostridia bacterium]|nr:ECF transporter S component [Clostridia bacterium]
MEKIRSKSNSSAAIKKLVVAAMFTALAFASMFVMRINVIFLTFDAKDAIVTIAGLLLGPLYSLAISLTVSILELVTVGDTGLWGFIMDFLSTAVFSCSCALIYKYKKNMKGAISGLISAVIAMTAFMLLFNLFIVPLYNPAYTTAAVATMVPTLFLPFNLTKGLLNSAIVLILYKPVSKALKAVKILPKSDFSAPVGEDAKLRAKKNMAFSLTVTLIGFAVVAICLVIFFIFLDGDFMLVENIK